MFCWLSDVPLALLLMLDLQGKQGYEMRGMQNNLMTHHLFKTYSILSDFATKSFRLSRSRTPVTQLVHSSSHKVCVCTCVCVLVGVYMHCSMLNNCQQGLSKLPSSRVCLTQRVSHKQTHNPMCKWGLQHDACVLIAFHNSFSVRKQSIKALCVKKKSLKQLAEQL